MEKLETSHSGNPTVNHVELYLIHCMYILAYFQSVFPHNILTVIYLCNHLSL